MITYKVLSIFVWFQVLSAGYLIFRMIKKAKEFQSKRFWDWFWILLLAISMGLTVWLTLNKEFFHWNYDIATGEPVDHYSTYGSCMLYSVCALLCNAVSGIIHFLPNHSKNSR